MRQRFPLGQATSGTGATLGASGGSIGHTHSGPSHSHTLDPASVNTGSEPDHTHTIPSTSSAGSHAHTVPTTDFETVGGTLSSGTSGLLADEDIDHNHSFTDGVSSSPSHNHPGNTWGFSSFSHSHTITDTLDTYLAPDNSHRHTHFGSNTVSDGSHAHSINATVGNGGHNHSINVGSFSTSSDGTGGTGPHEVAYITLQAIIKT